jgi:hypothetical protein
VESTAVVFRSSAVDGIGEAAGRSCELALVAPVVDTLSSHTRARSARTSMSNTNDSKRCFSISIVTKPIDVLSFTERLNQRTWASDFAADMWLMPKPIDALFLKLGAPTSGLAATSGVGLLILRLTCVKHVFRVTFRFFHGRLRNHICTGIINFLFSSHYLGARAV